MYRFLTVSALFSTLFFTVSCSEDDKSGGTTEPPITEGRWITVAGAVMGVTNATPGDGNGGTIVYSISKENAKDPSKSYDVFENGYVVPSYRTARLQSSQDGSRLFSIAYGEPSGGEYSKFIVNGGKNFEQTGALVNISQYAGFSPRWAKLFDGDKTGIAVNVTTPTVVTQGTTYVRTRGIATVLSLDLVNSFISDVKTYEIPLTQAEEIQGHHIFRLDAPVLNKAGNKLIIGTWMRKTDTNTGLNQTEFTRLGSKSVVVDYPSLENPVVINSTVGFGDTSGYRSFNAFVGDDGNIYQATQRDTNGSHILRINQNNQYDNSYVFSLDAALGVENSYIETWKYAGNGKAIVAYTYDAAPVSALSNQSQSFLALVDLNTKTAEKIDLPYDVDMYLFQYQGFVIDGYDIYVTLAPVGKDGRIYIINSQTGNVTEGAKLINKPGNHFTGAF
ncbi:MAG: hypothetical protein EOO43_17735 [Flavobacterium sp.]|nr:MAG: hypothetical protein EOO43_17735 [Flavobacterium sp.]